MFQGVFQWRDALDNVGMKPSPARDNSGATADMQLDAAVGPFYTPASMGEAIGESRSSIYRRITAGTVLAARLQNERWVCPTWQVVDDAVHPDLVATWRKLTDSADEWTALLWLSSPNEDLCGLSPAQWCTRGHDAAAALESASRTASRWA